jgi:hypothetical protein
MDKNISIPDLRHSLTQWKWLADEKIIYVCTAMYKTTPLVKFIHQKNERRTVRHIVCRGFQRIFLGS